MPCRRGGTRRVDRKSCESIAETGEAHLAHALVVVVAGVGAGTRDDEFGAKERRVLLERVIVDDASGLGG